MLSKTLLVFIGLANGIAVGGGFVAFLVVLDLLPRLAQISRAFHRISWLEGAVISGVIFWTLSDFYHWRLHLFPMGAALIGVFSGMFVGMLAAALTEVLNVLPILAKRLQLSGYIIWLLIAMMMGKVVGSLFHWIVF